MHHAAPKNSVAQHVVKIMGSCKVSRVAVVIVADVAEQPDKRIDGSNYKQKNRGQKHQPGGGFSLVLQRCMFFLKQFHRSLLDNQYGKKSARTLLHGTVWFGQSTANWDSLELIGRITCRDTAACLSTDAAGQNL